MIGQLRRYHVVHANDSEIVPFSLYEHMDIFQESYFKNEHVFGIDCFRLRESVDRGSDEQQSDRETPVSIESIVDRIVPVGGTPRRVGHSRHLGWNIHVQFDQ